MTSEHIFYSYEFSKIGNEFLGQTHQRMYTDLF